MKIAYQAIFESAEEGGFCVCFPDLPDAITEGDSWEEALFNAEEVLNLTLQGRMEEEMETPEPKEHEGGVWIYPSPQVQAALLVRFARRGKSLADLARALGTSWPSAQRLENPKASPNLRQLQKAATALGQRLVLVFEPIKNA
jgi:antitoxin HicB